MGFSLPLRWHAQSRARALAILVLSIATLALLGWELDVPGLESLIPGATPMSPVTAVAFFLAGLGIALSSYSGWVGSTGQILLGAVALIGATEIVQLMTGLEFGVDRLLFAESIRVASRIHPGRMAPVAALNFVLIGAGVLLGHRPGRQTSFVGQTFVVVALLLTVHALFGYAYGLESFYGPFATTPMAFSTAIAFGILTFSCLYAGPPDRGIGAVFGDPGPSGALLRRMLPVLLLTPLLLAWAAAAGKNAGYFGPGFATALVSTGNSALLVGFLAWLVLNMRRADQSLHVAVGDLAASERMFRVSFENAFVGMAHLGASRRWMRVNPRLADLLGYEPDALLEQPLAQLVHPEHLPILEERLSALHEGRTDLYTGEVGWTTRDGELRWFDVHVTARRSSAGEFRHFILVAQDVTPAKRMAEQLRVQSRGLEAAGTGIVITDSPRRDHPIVYVNPAFEQLTGYGREEVMGQNCRFLNRLARDQPELDEVRRALGAGQPCTVVLKNHTKDGTLFWNELTLSPVLDEHGTVTHFIGIQNDITKRLKLAVEAEASLNTALEERSRALEAARARDVLLAIVSHELRSPLNSIRLWASLLQADANPDAATIQKAIRQIDSSVETQSRLINDLLDVSRIVSGKLELERDRIDLCALAKEVAAELLPTAEGKRIRIEIRCPEGSAIVDGDRTRLMQAARNLIDNAIKFTPEGGSIEVVVEACEPEVELRVRDDGSGIAPEHLPRLFDQFWQGEATRPHKGLGLGLSIVKLLVERHGGRVLATSDGIGRGSTFSLRLPLVERGQAVAVVSSLAEGARLPLGDVGADILVVDDESSTAEALALALSMRGLQVRVAHDAHSALAAIAKRRPRVVVSDLMMPGLSGFELLERIREEEHQRKLLRMLAIAISGRGSPSDRWRVRHAGFDAYMPKPVDVQALFQWIESALTRPLIVEPAGLRVLTLGGGADLVAKLRQAGHEVFTACDLSEASRIGAESRPGVLLVELDGLEGDVKKLISHLRENRSSLFVVGMSRERDPAPDHETFDVLLDGPPEFEKLRLALDRAQGI